jgi:hypothetical protein
VARSLNSNSDKVFSRADIQGMSTDEIHQFMVRFKKLIREARVSGRDTYDYEVEYCYLDNENQLRTQYEFTAVKPTDRRPRGADSRRRPSDHSDRGDRSRHSHTQKREKF